MWGANYLCPPTASYLFVLFDRLGDLLPFCFSTAHRALLNARITADENIHFPMDKKTLEMNAGSHIT
jgi:hypothetical protein